MTRLAVRPEPLENESFNGFLLRIGKLNCMFENSEIVNYLGCDPTTAPGHSGWLETPSKHIFRSLERKLERPLNKQQARFKERDQLRWLFAKDRMVFDLRLGFPRICPACVLEHGTLDWRWGLAVTAHCPEHECRLTSSCPNCERKLKWTSSLLIGCPHCEQSWGKIPYPRESMITNTERQLWKDMGTGTGTMDESLLHDICLAIVVSMRPFDLIFESVRTCPRMMDYSQFVARAYTLLENPSANASWREQCHEKRGELSFLGNNFVEAPCDHFRSLLLKSWQGPHEQAVVAKEASSGEHNFPETTQYVSQSRRDKALESNGQANYRYQISVVSFARELGLSNDSALDYFRGDILQSHKNVKNSTSRRFDLREFRRFFQDRPSPSNSIEIFPDNPIFSKFPATFGRLANDMILGKVDGGFSASSGIKALSIQTDVLKKWLTDQLIRKDVNGLSMKRATKALNCSRQHIRDLVASGSLEWAGESLFEPRVGNQSFCKYVLRSAEMI